MKPTAKVASAKMKAVVGVDAGEEMGGEIACERAVQEKVVPLEERAERRGADDVRGHRTADTDALASVATPLRPARFRLALAVVLVSLLQLLISGWNLAMFCIDLNCLSVSGISARADARSSARRSTSPSRSPTLSWKNMRIASKKSISGWRTLAKTSTVSGAEASGSGRAAEERLRVRPGRSRRG